MSRMDDLMGHWYVSFDGLYLSPPAPQGAQVSPAAARGLQLGRIDAILSWLLLITPADAGHEAFIGLVHEGLECGIWRGWTGAWRC